MEDVIIEIPEMPQVTEEVTWVPPVITEQPQETQPRVQSTADVFFMQYILRILLLTLLLVIRLYDEGVFTEVTESFRSGTAAPSEPWAEAFVTMVQNLWK